MFSNSLNNKQDPLEPQNRLQGLAQKDFVGVGSIDIGGVE